MKAILVVVVSLFTFAWIEVFKVCERGSVYNLFCMNLVIKLFLKIVKSLNYYP